MASPLYGVRPQQFGSPPPFFAPDQSQLMQAMPGQMQPGQPQAPVVDTTQAPGAQNQLLEAMRARAMANQIGGAQDIQATSPLTALAATLQGGLKGYTQGLAQDREVAQQEASDKEINDALASPTPLEALSHVQSPEGRAAYRTLRLADLSKEHWKPVDQDGDGNNDFLTNGAGEIQPMPQTQAQRLDFFNQTTGAENAKNRAAELERARIAAGAKTGVLPQRVQQAEDDDISAIQTTQSINTQLDAVLEQIGSGKLELGAFNNAVGTAANAIGWSTPNSRNLASFQATLEKMRNDSLKLAKGVQTEGDAVRAWNEVLRNINDSKVVTQQLTRIRSLNELSAQQRMQSISVRRQRNNAPAFDFSEIARPDVALPSSQTGPQPGTVEDGFKFKGGNPADPNSWERVQ